MRLLIALRRFANSNACSALHSERCNVLNYVQHRNYARDLKLKWVRPPNIPSYDASQSGDLTPFQMPSDNEMRQFFDRPELIDNIKNENVKKIFLNKNQPLRQKYYLYKIKFVDQVKSHEYDNSSLEVIIARLTARIRIMQYILPLKRKSRPFRNPLNLLIHKRRRLLKKLRQLDYKKFEWLLEKLDLKYYPEPIKKEKVTRKNSMKLLAGLRREKLKELRLGEHKQKLDLEKVPFLEKKLKMLKYIKEQESAFQLEQTVTDSDIEYCIKQIEKVKLQVEENQKMGYVKKVHPYTLEHYNPKIIEMANTN